MDEPELGQEHDNPNDLNEKFRPLVEALHRAQQRARQEREARAERMDDRQPTEAKPQKWTTDKDGIQGAVRSAIPEIRECYEAWLNLNPALQGKLIVSFKIEASEEDENTATVVDAKVKEGGVGNQFLDGCVVASLGTLQFDIPPDGGVMDVTYPFTFRSSDEEEAE